MLEAERAQYSRVGGRGGEKEREQTAGICKAMGKSKGGSGRWRLGEAEARRAAKEWRGKAG